MRSQGGWAASGGTAEQGQRCSGRGDAQRLLISPCPHCPCPCHPLPCAAADSCAAAGTFADPGDTCWRAGGEWIDTDPHDRPATTTHCTHPIPLTPSPDTPSTPSPESQPPAALQHQIPWCQQLESAGGPASVCCGNLQRQSAAVGGEQGGLSKRAGGSSSVQLVRHPFRPADRRKGLQPLQLRCTTPATKWDARSQRFINEIHSRA